MTTKPKYRPVLNATEVKYAARFFRLLYNHNFTKLPHNPETPGNPERAFSAVEEDYCLQLLNKFNTLAAKIDNSTVRPAYTTKAVPREAKLLQDLGEELPNTIEAQQELPPGVRRLAAYAKYQDSPDLCTASELADAAEYRFQNDLMTAEEASAYEARQWEAASGTVSTKASEDKDI